MCDCYEHRCCADDCIATIPIHLEDYSTNRDEIVVLCEEHMGPYLKGYEYARVYTYFDDDDNTWKRCCIISLTENAVQHIDGNTPNAQLSTDKPIDEGSESEAD